MKNSKTLLLAGLVAALASVALLWFIGRPRGGKDTSAPLLFYCVAGVKPPVLKLAQDFEKAYGVKVQLQYGGSGTLPSNIEVSRKGDLYLAADERYIQAAAKKGLIAETLPLAYQRPVIAVKKGNPKNIRGLEDLLRPDVRLALGSPEAASIGRQTKNVLEKAGVWTAVEKQVRANGVFKPTVPELADDVKLGAVDAAIVWDATAAQVPELESIRLSVFDTAKQEIRVAVLQSSTQPTSALRVI